jgi:gamma-glutamyltranspeptidase/glutathione hydrolase
MSPMLVMKDGKPCAAFGLPGGQRIVSVTTQLAVNLIDFKAPAERMVTAPRIHADGSNLVNMSGDMRVEVAERLKQSGYQVERPGNVGGGTNAIVLDPETGTVQAAASNSAAGGVMVF